MNRLLCIWLLVVTPAALFSQDSFLRWAGKPSGLLEKKATPSSLDLAFTLSSVDIEHHSVKDASFNRLQVKGFTHESPVGEPELPVFQKLIVLPPDGSAHITVSSRKKITIDLRERGYQDPIYPTQPPYLKNQFPQERPLHINRELYSKDTLLQNQVVRIISVGTMRGKKIGLLSISPVAYNPLKNTIEIVSELDVRIDFPENAAPETNGGYESATYETIFNGLLNHQIKSGGTAIPEKFVILADTMFREVLKPFIAWKTLKGFKVIELYKGEGNMGTTPEEMRNFLANLYHSATEEDPAFTHLLIVGDHEQIPAFQPSHYTDLYYAEYDGNGDYLPDVLYGRFSARDTLELIPQIEKTMEYEQYLFPDAAFLNQAVMIAGVDGTFASKWGNGHINYATGYYINTDHGIQSHTYLYPESGSSEAQIIQNISNGVGFVNYTGHGEWDRWIDPAFHLDDIPTLQNQSKYPLMIGNGCVTTTFSSYGECFGEAILRAKNKGALGYIGCSNDSYWDEDYWWAVGVGTISANPTYEQTTLGMYDRSFHEFGETPIEWAQTQAQFVYAGNMAVMEGSFSKAKYYWEIYHLLGDPSLMVYFSEADSMMAHFPDTIPIGSDRLQIITHPHVYAGLTRHGTLLAAGYSNSTGLIDIRFLPQDTEGDLVLVLTGQNLKPLISNIRLGNMSGPYVTLDSIAIDDQAGNANGQADYGETIFIDIGLKNLGFAEAIDLHSTLNASESYLTLVDSIHAWGNLESQSFTLVEGVFELQIKDSVPDQWPVTLEVEITDQSGLSHSEYFQLELQSPVLESGQLKIVDNTLGNGNSRIEPGETVEIQIEAWNTGHSQTTGLYGKLSSADTLLEFIVDSSFLGHILPGETATASYLLKVDSLTPKGKPIPLHVVQKMPPYESQATFIIYPGLVYEDFELGTFASFNWQNDAGSPWQIIENHTFEGRFSAQSGPVQNNQASELKIELFIPEDDSISFYRKVSSEYNYDFLRFYIDDNQVERWSGTLDWENVSFPVPSGTHTLRWIYTKDVSVSNGLDKSWIDFIQFPDKSFLRKNTGVLQIIEPTSDVMLSDQEILSVEIRNFGTDTLYEIPLGVTINGIQTILDTIRASILPGTNLLFSFETTLDLSTPGSYEFQVYTTLNGDEVPGNDTVFSTIIHLIADASLVRFIQPGQDQEYSDHETITIVLMNEGTYGFSDIQVGYRMNDDPEVLETITINSILQPGDSMHYSFFTTADMSAFGTYVLKAFSRVPYDEIQQNDTITGAFEHINTDIEHPPVHSGFRLFPNPFLDRISMICDEAETVEVHVMDLTGRTLLIHHYSQLQEGQVIEIELGCLSSGMYLFNIKTVQFEQRFILMKE